MTGRKQSGPPDRQDLDRRIRACMDSGNMAQALVQVDAAIGALPSHRPFRIWRGIVLRALGRVQESLEELDLLRREQPENAGILHQLSLTHRAAGDFARSGALLDAVLARNPKHRGARLAVVDMAVRRQDFDRALSDLDAAREVLPADPGLEARRGGVLRSLGRVQESRDELERCLALHPGNAGLEMELARTCLLDEDYPASAARVEDVLGRDPAHRPAWLLRIEIAKQANDLPQALSLAETASPVLGDVPALVLKKIAILRALERPGAAMAALEDMQARHGPSLPARLAEAGIRVQLGQVDEAGLLYDRILTEDGLDPQAIAGKIRLAILQGPERPGFLTVVTGLRARIVADAGAAGLDEDRLLAGIAARIGDWESLAEHSERLLRRQPRDSNHLLRLARARFGMGQLASAKECVLAVIAAAPNGTGALTLLADLELALGNVTASLELRRKLLARSGRSRLPQEWILERDLMALGRAKEARARLDALRWQHDPAPTPAYLNLLDLHLDFEGVRDCTDRLNAARANSAGPEDPVVVPGRAALPERAEEGAFVTEADLADLFDGDGKAAFVSPHLYPALNLAWQLSTDRRTGFNLWQSRILRATHAAHVLSRRPVRAESFAPFLADIDLRPVQALAQAGRPMLLVGSHSGPKAGAVLARHLPNASYMHRGHVSVSQWETGTSDISLTEGFEAVAIKCIAALKAGRALITTPDVPLQLTRRGTASHGGNGMLFGVACPVLNTVPKLSQELGIPSFWLQPVWRNGLIHIELEELPMSRAGEPRQAWYDRWAGEYLARVERLMRSEAENQSLRVPYWRYLLLRGGSPGLPRPGGEGARARDLHLSL